MASSQHWADCVAAASADEQVLQLSDKSRPKRAYDPVRRVERSMLQNWITEEARVSASGWLVRLLVGAPDRPKNSQDRIFLHHTELAALRRQCEDVIYKNTSIPLNGFYLPMDRLALEMVPDIESPPSLSDGSSLDDMRISEEEILESLLQLLYKALFLPKQTSHAAHGDEPKHNRASATSLGEEAPAKDGKQKRRATGKRGNSGNDDEDGPERSKQGRMTPRDLDDLTREFACPLGKGHERLGVEARCRDWSSPNIITVVRHHLQKHVDCHIDEDTYNTANRLMKGVPLRNPGAASKLWTDVFMLLFAVAETDRDTVPIPYWEAPKGLQNDPHYRRFGLARRQQLSRNPAYADKWAQFLEQRDELEGERNKRKARAEKNFKDRQSRLEAELEQTKAEIDREIDEEQRVLKDRCIRQLGDTDPCAPPLAPHTDQPAGPALGYTILRPSQGSEQMIPKQAQQTSFAGDGLSLPSTLPTPPASLDPRLVTSAPRGSQDSVSIYEQPSPLPEDAALPMAPTAGLTQGLPGCEFDAYLNYDGTA